jgi:hypothetical protein
LVGVTALACLAVRSVQDWLLVTLALGIPHLSAWVRAWRLKTLRCTRRLESIGMSHPSQPLSGASAFARAVRFFGKPFYKRPLRFQWTWAAAVVLLLAGMSLIPPLARRMPIQSSKEWPVQALDQIEERGLQGRFFAIPDFGSYIGWRLGERAKVYVDTRGFFFPPEVIEDSFYVPQMADRWESRMDRVLACGTDYFLLQKDGPCGVLWQALCPHISKPLYADDTTVLLSRDQVIEALPRIRRDYRLARAAR